MSATGRGKPAQNDYQTPIWVIEKLINNHTFPTTTKRPFIFLEPCAGEGRIVQTFQRYYERLYVNSGTWLAVEKNAKWCEKLFATAKYLPLKRTEIFFANFLELDLPITKIDYIITNPPYRSDDGKDRNYAQKILQKCYNICSPDGQIAFLLRLNFLGSKTRKDFNNRLSLKKLLIITPRPSFTEDGKTDATEYAWFIYQKGWIGDTVIKVV